MKRTVSLVLSVLILITLFIPAKNISAKMMNKNEKKRVKPGIEVLVEKNLDLLHNKKVGIITNPTGVMPDLTNDVDFLSKQKGVTLVAVFGPEHGFRGTAQAGGSEGYYIDKKTNLPVYDLYGKNRDQIAEIFKKSGVDLLLFDIQDVGARFYTYIWTMSDSMEAAAIDKIPFIVLDRPNPIGGVNVEGPILNTSFSSFVGRYPIAQQHGMTIGELAMMFNEEFVPQKTNGLKADLKVIKMENWNRDMLYKDTGLPWVMPSPNMPTEDTAIVYPGTCMIEGTNLSEGRGTTRPFELIGAPYIDDQLATSLNRLKIPGAIFREAYFTPTFSKYLNQTVGGIQIYVTDKSKFDPIKTTLYIITETKKIYGDKFQWRSDNWIDYLTGSDYIRKSIDAGKDVNEIVKGWQNDLDNFKKLREKYLLYK